jgi:hypothetical protein
MRAINAKSGVNLVRAPNNAKNSIDLTLKIEEILKERGDWMTIKEVAAMLDQNVMFMSGYLTAMYHLGKIKYMEKGVVRMFRM